MILVADSGVQAAGVGREVDLSLAGIDSSRPLWEVIQAMNWKHFHKDCVGCRWPSEAEQRSMTWQAVCRGANGIIVRIRFFKMLSE